MLRHLRGGQTPWDQFPAANFALRRQSLTSHYIQSHNSGYHKALR